MNKGMINQYDERVIEGIKEKGYYISITKLTDKSLIARVCGTTAGRVCHPSTARMFATEHSPIRTQIYLVECFNIPLAMSTHFIRHGVGSQPYAHSYRTDRNESMPTIQDYMKELNEWVVKLRNGDISKEEFEKEYNKAQKTILAKTDRNTPTNLTLQINAQGLIDMAKLRLCNMSSKKTIEIFKEVKAKMGEVEPTLEPFLVPKCIYRNGICCEVRPCGYCKTKAFDKASEEYRKLFKFARDIMPMNLMIEVESLKNM